MNVGITGMTCSACSTRIEKVLNRMEGVEANVNLAMEKATIHYDDDYVQPSDITAKIEKLGYGVQKEQVELDIHGMTCSACSTRIQKVLSKMDGVEQATINLATEAGFVEYEPDRVSIDDIIAKVKKLGYEAVIKQERETEKEQKEARIKQQKIKLFVSALLSCLFYTR